jgi:predicted methyltransferase
VVAVTKAGQRIEGVALNEDDLSIQLRDAAGNPRSFLKQNLKELHREERSLMPSYASKLSALEIDHLVAYLRTLRGAPIAPVARTREIARVSENISWLTRPDRDADERPETLLDALRIPRGATVVDLGAGTGYFTRRLAQRVGRQGNVIAVDIQQEMLDRIATQQLANVELVLGAEHDPHLPPAPVDLVLIANAYHEFSDPPAILAAVHRSLKPNGRLVVLEYSKENPHSPVSAPHSMSIDEIRSEIEPIGFQLDRILDFLPMQHGLIFTMHP